MIDIVWILCKVYVWGSKCVNGFVKLLEELVNFLNVKVLEC